MGDIEIAMTDLHRQRRRWRFASAIFDESRWMLTVDGRPASVEIKPLQLLRELLLRPGEVVTKDELLDIVWPNVTVVEASLSTAMAKLRRALGDADGHLIETVPRLGYRLVAPVEAEIQTASSITLTSVLRDIRTPRSWPRRWAGAAGLLMLALAVGWLAVVRFSPGSEAAPPHVSSPTRSEAMSAIRTLDYAKVENLIGRGWNPNTAFDAEGNGAMNMLLNICEWDPAHDRRAMLLVARTLIEAGARLDTHNKWGDTAYSIAKAKRYCGPDHPVTVMIRRMCTQGYKPLGDRCLATYDHRW